MDISKLSVRVRRNAHGPATAALSRAGLDKLVDDAFLALTVLNSEITPESVREYVEVNVRINVFTGRYFAPLASDMESVLEQSRLEDRCAAHADDSEPDAEVVPSFC